MAKANLGRVSIVSRGEYNPTTKYERLDVVSYQGSSYIAKQDCTGVHPSTKSYWDLLAEKGEIESATEIKERLTRIDGIIPFEFEVGTVSLNADNTGLAYSSNNTSVRSKGVCFAPAGTSFVLSDFSEAKLFVYYTYDGITYAMYSRDLTEDPIILTQDAYVAVKVSSRSQTAQTDTSLSDLLIVECDTTLFDEITAKNLNKITLWEAGAFNTTTGETAKVSNRARTITYLSEEVDRIEVSGVVSYLLAWGRDDTYVGKYVEGSGFVTEGTATSFGNLIDISKIRKEFPLYKFKMMSIVTSIEDVEKIKFYNKIYSVIYEATRKPMVSFVDDDGWAEALDNWEAISNETGVRPTFAIATDGVGTKDGRATWEQIKRLWNKGFEFISHTHNHTKLTNVTDEVVESELSTSINAFNEHGMKCEFLAYPNNSTDERVMTIARKYFKGAVTHGNKSNVPPIRPLALYRESINLDSQVTKTFEDGTTRSVFEFRPEEEVFGAIDQAVEKKGWVIFMTHIRNRDTFYYNDEIKDRLIRLIKYAVQNGCELATLSEGFDVYKNRFEKGIYNYGSGHYIIDADGVTHEK